MKLVRFAVLISSILLLGRCSPGAEEIPQKSGATLRNVVVIIGDDHATSALGAYGNDLIHTPNLDRLASQGITFLRAYANSPVCTPSRQSLLTGRYPHAAGVTLLRTALPSEQVTLAEHLKEQGYRTGVVGKTHFNSDLPHGFDTLIQRADYHRFKDQLPPRALPDSIRTRKMPWRPFRDPARLWLNADALPDTTYDADSEGTYLAQQAINFIQDNQDTSFLLWLGFYEPHSPFNFPIEYAEKYDPADMILPETSAEDDRWMPEVFRDLSEGR